MKNKKQLGAEGERFVCAYLQHQQYKIECVNWRCRWGEIDIVASKSGTLYFIEVRTRTVYEHSSPSFGYAVEALSSMKAKKLYQLAQLYIHQLNDKAVNFKILFAPVHYYPDKQSFHLVSILTPYY